MFVISDPSIANAQHLVARDELKWKVKKSRLYNKKQPFMVGISYRAEIKQTHLIIMEKDIWVDATSMGEACLGSTAVSPFQTQSFSRYAVVYHKCPNK